MHTEMLTDSVMDLYEYGAVITNRRKTFHPGKIVCGFCIGTRSSTTSSTTTRSASLRRSTILITSTTSRENDHMVSINNTMTVDLTGQCASESLGHSMYSGDRRPGGLRTRGGNVKGRHVVHRAALHVHDKKRPDLAGRLPVSARDDRDDAPLRRPLYRDRKRGAPTCGSRACPSRVREVLKIAHPDFRDQLKHEAEQAGLLF